MGVNSKYDRVITINDLGKTLGELIIVDDGTTFADAEADAKTSAAHKAKKMYEKNKRNTINSGEFKDTVRNIRSTLIGTPKDYAIRAAVSAVRQVPRVISNISRDKANKLATAILAGSRNMNTGRRAELYGNSIAGAAEQMALNRKLYGLGKVATISDSVGNVLDDTVGKYVNDIDRANVAAAGMYSSSPSSMFDYMNGSERREERKNRYGRD